MRTPLLIPAIALSAGSLAWTTWSLVDLLGAGAIGLTVAAGADIIWASVIAAEARGLRIAGRRWLVAAIGWAALAAVAGFLVWHGISRDHTAMAVAGPLLPIGAKLVWLLALADMRDPTALTDDEKAKLAAMERGMRFEEAEHRMKLRRREMGTELLIADAVMDFEIDLARQDQRRELARRAPIVITPAQPAEPLAQVGTQQLSESFPAPGNMLVSTTEPSAQRAEPFGFSAHASAQSAQRAEAIEKVAELLAQDPGLTAAQVEERLSVSPATAKRYLREARAPRGGTK